MYVYLHPFGGVRSGDLAIDDAADESELVER